jgi:hypothetical protein
VLQRPPSHVGKSETGPINIVQRAYGNKTAGYWKTVKNVVVTLMNIDVSY